MIVRILGEGQYELADGSIEALNALDATLEAAVKNGDHEGYHAALAALLAEVRRSGTRLPDDALVSSDAIVPADDADLEEVTAMLGEEGLIPG